MLTILEAVTEVARLINDPAKRRDGDGDIEAALRGKLSATLGWYAHQGGEFYSQVVEVTTSAQGESDLSIYKPLRIHGVSIVNGADVLVPIRHQPLSFVRRFRREAKPLWVLLTRTPDTTWAEDDDPLIAGVDTDTPHEGDLECFDRLVCYRAAIELMAPDDKTLRALKDQEVAYMADLKKILTISTSWLPDQAGKSSYGWTLRPDTQVFSLTVVSR